MRDLGRMAIGLVAIIVVLVLVSDFLKIASPRIRYEPQIEGAVNVSPATP